MFLILRHRQTLFHHISINIENIMVGQIQFSAKVSKSVAECQLFDSDSSGRKIKSFQASSLTAAIALDFTCIATAALTSRSIFCVPSSTAAIPIWESAALNLLSSS